MEGYKLMFNDTIVTVWSAPNYCYRCGNVAAILEIDEHMNKQYRIFEAAPQVPSNPQLTIGRKRSSCKETCPRLLLIDCKLKLSCIFIQELHT
jgi:hypothetical protein